MLDKQGVYKSFDMSVPRTSSDRQLHGWVLAYMHAHSRAKDVKPSIHADPFWCLYKVAVGPGNSQCALLCIPEIYLAFISAQGPLCKRGGNFSTPTRF